MTAAPTFSSSKGGLRTLSQIERKQALLELLLGENDIGLPVLYSEH
jgi:hypothetical protein